MNIFVIFYFLVIAGKITCIPSDGQSGISNGENKIGGNKRQVEENLGKPLDEIDFRNAKLLDLDALNAMMAKTHGEEEDPLLRAGLFEGDIVRATEDDTLLSGRNALVDKQYHWPNGTIPYIISADFDSFERSIIARAISEYHNKTCIQFKPRMGEIDYVYIIKGKSCSSPVGRQGERQDLSLGKGCLHFGIVIHELMHTLGFWHEQSRADRDDFIIIDWSNIRKGMDHNFKKYTWKYIQNLGESYDLNSVLHYGKHVFAANRSLPTIIPRKNTNPELVKMGQRDGFSPGDLRKINKLYKCFDREESKRVTTVKTVENCEDLNCECPFWASIGECDKNPNYMHLYCKMSCSTC